MKDDEYERKDEEPKRRARKVNKYKGDHASTVGPNSAANWQADIQQGKLIVQPDSVAVWRGRIYIANVHSVRLSARALPRTGAFLGDEAVSISPPFCPVPRGAGYN